MQSPKNTTITIPNSQDINIDEHNRTEIVQKPYGRILATNEFRRPPLKRMNGMRNIFEKVSIYKLYSYFF